MKTPENIRLLSDGASVRNADGCAYKSRNPIAKPYCFEATGEAGTWFATAAEALAAFPMHATNQATQHTPGHGNFLCAVAFDETGVPFEEVQAAQEKVMAIVSSHAELLTALEAANQMLGLLDKSASSALDQIKVGFQRLNADLINAREVADQARVTIARAKGQS